MQFEPVVLFTVFGCPVYAFGACLAAAAFICAFFLKRREKKRGIASSTASVFVFYALILGIVCSRLFYCLLRWQQIAYDFDDVFRGYAVILRIWDGGMTVYGAFAGVALAALVTARRTRQPYLKLLDWAAPPCSLMLALGRGAEILGGGGFGGEVLEGGLTFFPVAVYNDWLGSWSYAVFMAEAAAALVILILLLRIERKPRRAGDIALLFLLYYGAAQTVLERMRRDDFLAWGFVLVAQVVCVVFILFVAGITLVRSFKAGMKKGPALLDGGLTLVVLGWAGLTEYLFDKNLFGVLVIDDTLLHLLRAALLAAISILLTARLLRAGDEQGPAAP